MLCILLEHAVEREIEKDWHCNGDVQTQDGHVQVARPEGCLGVKRHEIDKIGCVSTKVGQTKADHHRYLAALR